MQGLHVLLLYRLDLHKADIRSAYRLGDGSCIVEVVLVAPQVSLDVLGGINRTSCPSFSISRAQ
jgi:hypothetical protein